VIRFAISHATSCAIDSKVAVFDGMIRDLCGVSTNGVVRVCSSISACEFSCRFVVCSACNLKR